MRRTSTRTDEQGRPHRSWRSPSSLPRAATTTTTAATPPPPPPRNRRRPRPPPNRGTGGHHGARRPPPPPRSRRPRPRPPPQPRPRSPPTSASPRTRSRSACSPTCRARSPRSSPRSSPPRRCTGTSVNANGGIAGRQVELVIEDNGYDVADAPGEVRGDPRTRSAIISQSTGSPHTAAIAGQPGRGRPRRHPADVVLGLGRSGESARTCSRATRATASSR